MMRKVLFLVLLATAAPLTAATAAQAAFPGSNGKVAFERFVPRPDGARNPTSSRSIPTGPGSAT